MSKKNLRLMPANEFAALMRIFFAIATLALIIFVPLLAQWCGGDAGLRPSLSDYYYSTSCDLFEGLLFWAALSLMIFTFVLREGEEWSDWFAFFAGIGLLGVALFPCSEKTGPDKIGIFQLQKNLSNNIHGWVAIAFFILMAIAITTFLFKNNKYFIQRLFYGGAVLAILVLIISEFIYFIVEGKFPTLNPSIFTIEVIDLIWVALCWLLKGISELFGWANPTVRKRLPGTGRPEETG